MYYAQQAMRLTVYLYEIYLIKIDILKYLYKTPRIKFLIDSIDPIM